MAYQVCDKHWVDRVSMPCPICQLAIEREAREKAEAERDGLFALATELLAQLGWNGAGPDDTKIYYCEYCKKSHENYCLIKHKDNCNFRKWKKALAAMRKE